MFKSLVMTASLLVLACTAATANAASLKCLLTPIEQSRQIQGNQDVSFQPTQVSFNSFYEWNNKTLMFALKPRMVTTQSREMFWSYDLVPTTDNSAKLITLIMSDVGTGIAWELKSALGSSAGQIDKSSDSKAFSVGVQYALPEHRSGTAILSCFVSTGHVL